MRGGTSFICQNNSNVEGRLWAWELAEVRPLEPIPARGERMLFEVEP